jgi:glucan phosphoethanolaminetransferase (alkaline phosphatase superfamily)
MWSIRQIRIASAADGKAQQTLDRLTQFQSFYLYTVCYLYFTRIIVYLLVASLPYNNYYFAPLLSEIAAVAYYAGTGTWEVFISLSWCANIVRANFSLGRLEIPS